MDKLCNYGCGNMAKYHFKNGKYCCENSTNKCPKIKLSQKTVDKKIEMIILENSLEFCSYGCKNIAKFYFTKCNKFCCSDYYLSCSALHKKTMDAWLDKKLIINDSIICEYGCGEMAKYKSKSEKYCCSVNHSSCPSQRKRNSETNKIKQSGENNARYGVEISEETKKLISINTKKAYWNETEEYRENFRTRQKNLWKNEKFIKNWAKAKNSKPNKPETFLINLFKELRLNYEYTGDFSFMIEGKNPDFTNKIDKKIIEFFGDFWHSERFRPENETSFDHAKKRIDHFKNSGYDTLIIWEKEMKNLDNVVNKILKFSGGENE